MKRITALEDFGPINESWTGQLRKQYDSFEEFASYDDVYGLAKRLGFKTAKEAWDADPKVAGSTDPAEFRKLPAADKQRLAVGKKGMFKVAGSHVATAADRKKNPYASADSVTWEKQKKKQ